MFVSNKCLQLVQTLTPAYIQLRHDSIRYAYFSAYIIEKNISMSKPSQAAVTTQVMVELRQVMYTVHGKI